MRTSASFERFSFMYLTVWWAWTDLRSYETAWNCSSYRKEKWSTIMQHRNRIQTLAAFGYLFCIFMPRDLFCLFARWSYGLDSKPGINILCFPWSASRLNSIPINSCTFMDNMCARMTPVDQSTIIRLKFRSTWCWLKRQWPNRCFSSSRFYRSLSIIANERFWTSLILMQYGVNLLKFNYSVMSV